MSDSPILSVKPIINYPRQVQVGKTYLMTIDLQPDEGYEWKFKEEEYPIYCTVESDIFSSKVVGEPIILMHRFGGSYGAARFLMTALPKVGQGDIKVCLINAWGIRIKVLKITQIDILESSETSVFPPDIKIPVYKSIKDTNLGIDRTTQNVQVDHIYEAKIIIIGEGGAGKTTLSKKIQSSGYELQEENSTQGIDVTQWQFPLENKEFRVNIWDFGGQEIYHNTHQFFFSKHTLYILVVDTRKEDNDFYYWLNIVGLLSDNSPILIIKNEKYERQREINEKRLRDEFPNVQATLSSNLATNRGLTEIITQIKQNIMNLPHTGTELPKIWIKVREALEKDSRNYISLGEYFKLCEDNGFTRRRDKLQLSSYLHDLGVCLHFQEDSLLRKIVILKPTWGTNAVYKLLDNYQIIQNQGRFSRDDLKRIWYEDKYISMHLELLRLMMNFKLCYEIPNFPNTYIAPQLLTSIQPEYTWNEADNLRLRYEYEFMPKGILTRFLVEMQAWVEEQSCIWKSGVVLSKDGTRAEIIELYSYHKGEIHIRISGKRQRDLLRTICHELDKIHDSYDRLKYKVLVPCNCLTCKNSRDPHFYTLAILYKFLDNRKDVQCQNSFDMVNVRNLIDDLEYQSNEILESDELEDEDSNIEWQEIEFEVITIEFREYPTIVPFDFEVATIVFYSLGIIVPPMTLERVFSIANKAIKSHRGGEELTALEQEIIEGTWRKLNYEKIADMVEFSTGYVRKVGAALFRCLSEELGKSISKRDMVEVFSKIVPSQKSKLEIEKSPGRAYQFVEPLKDRVILEMVQIPAGEFIMGAPKEELDSKSLERPQHSVNVPEFYLGKYPITQEQWRFGASLPKIDYELKLDPSHFKGNNLPVETISWYDATEFCARLSHHTKREYRLPSEAEWEYACRAGTTTAFHFGETITTDLANYNGKDPYGRGSKGTESDKTTAVNKFPPNAFGLYDLHGNVWEWCQDHDRGDYTKAPTDGSAWLIDTAVRNAHRIARGGNFHFSAHQCRSASRYGLYSDYHDFTTGFRIAYSVGSTR